MDPSILLPPPRNVPVAVQVLWVTQKNFKLKMGAMGGFILEMLLPALLATALVPAWLAADRSRRPEREFSSMPVMDVPAIMEPYKCVADGVSITSPLTGLLYCACNTTATLPCIGVMCLDTTGDALTLYEIATTYEGPVVPPDLDIMILVQQAGKHGLIGDGSSMGHTSYTASFTVGTKIAIFSEIGGNDHLVELMKTYYRNRSVLFDEVFMSFESEGQLTDYTYDEGNAQMMGAIVVNGPYDYAIRVNRSATANTKMDQEWGDPSGLGKSYKKYITGGFITLQQMTNNFWLHYGSQGAHVALNDLVILPCYIPSYREDEFLVAAGRFLPLVAAISYLYFIGQYVSSMVKEKEDRIKEGMLVMGLSPAAFKLSWYLLGFFEGFVISLTLSIVYCASYFGNSSFFLLFMLLFLFSTSIVAGANLVACFFSKAQIAGLAAPFIFLATVIPRFATSNPDSLFMLNVLSAFPFSGGMTTISDLEKSGRGLSSDSLGDGEDPVKKAYMLLVMDTILYIVLEWYFSKVLPSEWGTHRHPCFCCPCVSSTPAEIDVKKVTCNRVEEVTDPDVLKREVVSIDNLTKCFSSETGVFTAVNTLSLKMYEGQALVLLGHNGAGKTTTINMLTGMLPVTSGDATVFGKSIVWNLSAIRKDIGLCPQHNILWPNLTCREHLMFFGRIRGLKDAELVNDVTKMLRDIDLEERADYRTCGLSGGMMRKLSVGIALIGGPRLIILDEPTAGMDIQARRAIWDLIKKNKKGRTMLLTTHFMDEADLLGDSIAIMSDGRLYSWGSGLYLKSSLGVGYNLRCEMNSKCVPSAVEAVLQNEVDQVNTDEKGCNKVGIVSQAGRELVLRLPMYAVSAFPKILRHLETGGDELGVDRFGISVTTLEEIFIKIAQNGNLVPNEEENTNKDLDFDISDVEKVTGSSLVVLQMKACFRKRLNCGKRDKRTLCYQLFLPVMLIALALGLSMIPIPSYPSKDLTPGHVTEAVLNPEQYGQDYVRNDRYVALSVGSTASWRGTEEVLRDTFYSHEKNRMCATVLNTTTSRYPYTYKPPAPCRELGNTTLQKSERRKSFLSNTVGVMQKLLVPSINDTHAAFFNGSFLHSLPQAVLVHHTALLRAVTGDNSLTINTVNSPFPNSKSLQARFESFATVILGLFVLIPFAIVPSTYVSFLVKERQCKAKHIQLASGVGLFAFWASTFIWDLCSYMVTTGAAFAMFGAFSRDEYIGNAENAMATLVLFFFYGLSSIGAAYVASFYFRTHTQAQSVVSGFSLFAGFVLVITTNILESIDSTKDVSRVLRHMFRVVPSFCVGDGIIAIAGIPIKTSYGMDPPGPFDMDVIGWDVLWMAIEAPIFYFITLAHDYPEILYILGIRKYAGEEASQDDEEVEEDNDVLTERRTVEAVDPVTQSGEYIITVNKLMKEYPSLGSISKTRAVKNVSFTVLKDEVFCLLGTNGAGKTTTLSIVSGEFPPTAGSVHVKGHDVVKDTYNARSELGYCPQFDALLDLLTPQEHLEFYCELRGVSGFKKYKLCALIIEVLGLDPHKHKLCKQLSGGNKRKVSIGISLTGAPAALLLDEPTAGMDPVARRTLWTALKLIGHGRSVILTTHHLEEVEALAQRVAIMVAGRIQCIGTLNHLKQKFGNGYELEIKVLSKDAIPEIESFVATNFSSSKLIEQTGERLIFRLNKDNLALSQVFSALQANAKDLNIVDYSISQTSLEQVFMSICKSWEGEQDALETLSSVTEEAVTPHLSLVVPNPLASRRSIRLTRS